MSGSHRVIEERGPAEGLTVGRLMRVVTTTVEPDAHVASAAYLIKHAGESALVVTQDDETRFPIAMITDADVTQAVADGRNLEDTRINQLRLPRTPVVSSGTPVDEAAERMLGQALQHLPVVDDGRLVGMVDLPAVCRALLRPAGPGGSAGDQPAGSGLVQA